MNVLVLGAVLTTAISLYTLRLPHKDTWANFFLWMGWPITAAILWAWAA